MTSTTEKVSVDDLKPSEFIAEIIDILRENPTNVNPFDDNLGSCVYLTADGRHCAVGAWMAKRGLSFYDDNDQLYDGAASDTIGHRLGQFGDVVQLYADGTGGYPNNTWGEVADILEGIDWEADYTSYGWE